MKLFLKMIVLIIIGLLTAIIIYPFLHESGHSVVALLVGAKIIQFNILPIPFVACEVSNTNIAEQIFIGLGGIVIPYLISMLLKPKWFWGWYVNLLLKCISIYAVMLSMIAIFLHINGNSWQNEDIIQILQVFPNGRWFFLVVFCIMATYGLMQLLKEHTLSKCMDYFNKTEKLIA